MVAAGFDDKSTNTSNNLGENMIECRKCGSENHFDGAMFCKSCGAELSSSRVTVKLKDDPASEQLQAKHPLTQSVTPNESDEPDYVIKDMLSKQDEQESEELSVESTSGSVSGFDKLLKSYEKSQTQDDMVETTPDESKSTSSLGIESPTDFLLREQSILHRNNAATPKNPSPVTVVPVRSRDVDKVKNPLSGSPFHMEAGAISSDDKGKLIDSLHKTFEAEESASESASGEREEGASASFNERHVEPSVVAVPHFVSSTSESVEPRTPASSSTLVTVSVRGHKLIFPSKVRPLPGESVTYNNHRYLIKKGNIDKKSWALGGVFVVILLAIVLVQGFNNAPVPKPMLFGVVTNSETKEVLAGVSITIPQTGASTITDEHGTFKFVGLADGRYDVKIEGGLYEARFFPITIKDGQSEIVYGTLNPLIPKVQSNNTVTPDPGGETSASAAPQYGGLKIKSNVADATVIVDDKALGMASQTFKKIAPGTHSLEIRRDGYQTYNQTVRVQEGEIVELAVNLDAVKPAAPVEYGASDFFRQAEALMSEKNYSEAIGYYTLALVKDNSMVQAYVRRAEADVLTGKALNARADYRSAADIYLHSSQFADAIGCYDKIIELSPNAADAFQLRGWARISAGDYEKGIKDLEKALSFNKEDTQSQFELGKALYITGNYKDSQKMLKKIRKYGDDSPEIYGYLALAYLAQGDESEARKVYDTFRKRANSTQVARMSTESGWQRLTALAGK